MIIGSKNYTSTSTNKIANDLASILNMTRASESSAGYVLHKGSNSSLGILVTSSCVVLTTNGTTSKIPATGSANSIGSVAIKYAAEYSDTGGIFSCCDSNDQPLSSMMCYFGWALAKSVVDDSDHYIYFHGQTSASNISLVSDEGETFSFSNTGATIVNNNQNLGWLAPVSIGNLYTKNLVLPVVFPHVDGLNAFSINGDRYIMPKPYSSPQYSRYAVRMHNES